MMPDATIHPPIRLPLEPLRQALAAYEKYADDFFADELSEEEKHLADTIRLLLQHIDQTDPAAVAQHTLDEHAIRPHWVRNGQQVHSLLTEAIADVLGLPAAAQTEATPVTTTPATAPVLFDDIDLRDAVLAALPFESAQNPMSFAEVSLRVTRKVDRTTTLVYAMIIALQERGLTVLQYGAGWAKTERD